MDNTINIPDHSALPQEWHDAIQKARAQLSNPAVQARLSADQLLREQYRNQYVAFVDEGHGDTFKRNVIAVAITKSEIRQQIDEKLGRADAEPRLIVRFVR